MKILKDVEMKPYSNMKIGGVAKELIYIDDKTELQEIFPMEGRFFLLGNGTNTLLSDGYLDISFISLKNLCDVTVERECGDYDLVRVEAGLDFNDLIKYMKENDYTGLENISGVPGSVGGLTNMNGGSYGTEIFDCIESIEVFDDKGEIKEYQKDEIEYKYRNTEMKQKKWIIISTLFKFYRGFDNESSEDKKSQRKMKHPLDLPNLGSTFKNPKGEFAAQLISDAGLKNHVIGNAMISEKHPNFIVNLGEAKFQDILDIVNHVKQVIKENNQIELETEIIILQ